jgi:hypothetical protein
MMTVSDNAPACEARYSNAAVNYDNDNVARPHTHPEAMNYV